MAMVVPSLACREISGESEGGIAAPLTQRILQRYSRKISHSAPQRDCGGCRSAASLPIALLVTDGRVIAAQAVAAFENRDSHAHPPLQAIRLIRDARGERSNPYALVEIEARPARAAAPPTLDGSPWRSCHGLFIM